MSKIYFTSGKTLMITKDEFERIAPKLQMGGIRMYRTGRQDLIPLNSTTIELIEREASEDAFDKEAVLTDVVKEKIHNVKIVKAPEKPLVVKEGFEPSEPEKVEEPVKLEKTESPQERNDRLLEEMKEKAACNHEGKMKIFYQATKAGNRFFPVCEYCGFRGRYVSVKKIKAGLLKDWTMEDLVKAEQYQEKK